MQPDKDLNQGPSAREADPLATELLRRVRPYCPTTIKSYRSYLTLAFQIITAF